MKGSLETWAALALLALAGGAVAAALLPPTHDRLEERCSPPAPEGEPVELRTNDEIRTVGGVTMRVIEFTPLAAGERVLLRTCASQDAQVVREEREPTLRVSVIARGYEPFDTLDAAEVKARAALGADGLTIVPRVELHGVDTLPWLRFELVVPANAAADVEAWP